MSFKKVIKKNDKESEVRYEDGNLYVPYVVYNLDTGRHDLFDLKIEHDVLSQIVLAIIEENKWEMR